MKVITSLFEKDDRLYGKSEFDGTGFNIYNLLNRPLTEWDFSQVVAGKELLDKYLPQKKESNA
jgi:hypothetical protein